ncbi:Rieske 2Fe-2S domain-containing protein [Tomitella fengzijianii]|uniref:Rieske-type oxygenase n=1 Tax=Tomitella fengzijianii TaxID=2597660 RepID=A0A516X6U6_9ACTN|nr:Rieske 2Fe-2S domain-containing protein [Tomitella fengzijianii]QDQ98797.1 Rieske 2Fe-2S domain-containing protein [Tomitella fengzijianii]
MTSMSLSMKPTGWFQIGWSDEIPAGEVVPLRFFGKELVAYRTESGRLAVLDAYCEHLGANLGYGGTVCGDDIQCPFHGWRWSPEGRNTCIPYQEKINRVRRIGTWTSAERDGVMFVWHDAAGRAPDHDVPSVFDLFSGSGTADEYHAVRPGGGFCETGLTIHPQYVIENGVDFAHFKYVHRADEMPEVVRRDFLEHEFRTALSMKFKRKAEDGSIEEVRGDVDAMILGVGLGYSFASAAGRVCSLTSVTPVDDETSTLWFSAWVSKEGEDEDTIRARQRSAISQVRADLAIWRHQRYTEPPGLATAEAAGFRDVRKWARRFYPEGHKGHEAADQMAGTDASVATASGGAER